MDHLRETALENTSFLLDVGFWEKRPRMHPERWLKNFTPSEIPFAARMLNSFIFISEESTRDLVRFAFSKLSRELLGECGVSFKEAKTSYAVLLNEAVVTFPTGERPNSSDSGFLFARFVRQEISFPENNLMENLDALESILRGTAKNLIFVDDLVGSGNQFCDTMEREHVTSVGRTSFEKVVSKFPEVNLFYCPLISTSYGLANIKRRHPYVKLFPVHIFDETYCLISEKCFVWEDCEFSEVKSFLESTTKRSGIIKDPYGFHRLALPLAFQHSMPDVTLPLFYHESENWKPLKIRS